MRTLKALATAMAVALFVNFLGAIGNAVPPTATGGASGAKTDSFSVISITGGSAAGGPAEDIRIVSATELDDLKKTILEEDKASEKAYKDAKKGAGAGGSDIPKPQKRKVTILKAGFKSEDDADAWRIKNPPGAPKGNARKGKAAN